MRVEAVFVGKSSVLKNPQNPLSTVESGIEKDVVEVLDVRKEGCEGDENVFEVHGGPDRAVLAFSTNDYARAEQAFGKVFCAPAWGENLLVSGVNEFNVTLGEVWAIGKDVKLQVTMPRKACFKLGWKHDCPLLANWANSEACGGWFLRCLTEGKVRPGDAVRVETKPFPTISMAMLRWPSTLSQPLLVQLVGDDSPLGQEWKDSLAKHIQPKPKPKPRSWCSKVVVNSLIGVFVASGIYAAFLLIQT